MKAYTSTGKEVSGKTLQDIRKKLNAMLSIDDQQAITAVTNTGAVIHVELFEGQDYIKLANGRIIK